MGERKGQNHYYPPDYDPKKGGLNKFLGTHALRERARKLDQGILIIRFEMPYNIWCDGCENHVGMGVRYNAEKTKVGMYYSTPVYQFKMKCTMCDNHYVIKTDPGNLDYVIVSGARRQENRWDPTDNGQVVPDDKDVQKRLFDDAMFKLEHGERDKGQAKVVKSALGRLELQREERWRDDYSANCALRQKFRIKRRELKASAEKDLALLAKSSLEIALLPETEEDKKMASLLALAPAKSSNERLDQSRDKIINRPALPSCSGNSTTFMGLRVAKHLDRTLNHSVLGIRTNRRPVSETLTRNATCDRSVSDVDSEETDLDSRAIPEPRLAICRAGADATEHSRSTTDIESKRLKLDASVRSEDGDNATETGVVRLDGTTECTKIAAAQTLSLVGGDYDSSGSEESG